MGPAFPPGRRRGQWWSWCHPSPLQPIPQAFQGSTPLSHVGHPASSKKVKLWPIGLCSWEGNRVESGPLRKWLSGFRSPAAWTKLAGEEIFYRVQLLRRLLY